MGQPVKGDIVVVPFPFTHMSAGKVRPALVISTPKAGEAILCQVTSTHRDDGYSEAISKTDFSQGRLDHDSYARVNPLFTVDVAVILRTAGRLREERTAVILDRIVSTLQNS
jgi:mRNA interferase MazF